jgi:hypothetical protein
MVITALLDCFRSEVRLASVRLPQKSQIESFFLENSPIHQSLQGPFLFVFVHLLSRPPTRHPKRSEGSPYVAAVFRPARATAASAVAPHVDFTSGSFFEYEGDAICAPKSVRDRILLLNSPL